MSIRSLIEINHDHFPTDNDETIRELMAFLGYYVRSGSRDHAEALERFGVKVVGMRHHSDSYIIKADADGFPATYLGKPR